MKIAYFSPFNPQKSGISDYSERLLPYLEKIADIDVWVDGIVPSNPSMNRYHMIDYSRNRKDKLKEYDIILYNIGNNPVFHGKMLDIFFKYPGIVILHDYVLFYLITGYYLNQKKDTNGYIREFYFNYGPLGIDYVKRLMRFHIPLLQYPSPQKYPLVKRILTTAKGIIVHSNSTRDFILKDEYPEDRIVHINHIDLVNYSKTINRDTSGKAAVRERYGIGKDDIMAASFGYVAPTKRNKQVIDAINDVIKAQGIPLQYLMVGEGNYVDAFLSDRVKKTGYIDLNEFEMILSSTDIVINLRYPSMGETSGTLLRAMSAGKPCIVSDNAWFSELPDSTLMKISIESEREHRELVNAISLLVNNGEMRDKLGRNAHEYMHIYHNPEKIVNEMKLFFLRILAMP
jgi:glycosyltransferase involved in cell wall biosynthesis